MIKNRYQIVISNFILFTIESTKAGEDEKQLMKGYNFFLWQTWVRERRKREERGERREWR